MLWFEGVDHLCKQDFQFLQLNNYRSVRHVMKNSISGRVSYSLLCM